MKYLFSLGYSFTNKIEVRLMTKRKKSAKSKESKAPKILNYIIWGLSVVALMLGVLLGGYYLGYNKAKSELQQVQSLEKQKRLALIKKLENVVKTENKTVSKRLREVLKKDAPRYISASHEIEDESLANPPKIIKTYKKVIHTKKPKLAIIIDDVSTASQIRAIKSLRMPVTMSFLPPSKARPNSAKLAAKEKFYMVHLPMEAMHFNKEEPFTLRVSDSQHEILERIKKIKQLFPKVKYINNHTGSKFTSDEIAMNRLIYAFNKYHIKFIDSRTTAQTKAPKVLKNFGLKYVPRDLFLDHHMDKAYVREQIKKAIAIAKRKGYAIAICHPHKNTLQVLYESKNLLRDVDLVQVDKIY